MGEDKTQGFNALYPIEVRQSFTDATTFSCPPEQSKRGSKTRFGGRLRLDNVIDVGNQRHFPER